MYEIAKNRQDRNLFFSYRVTKGLEAQFWNLMITQTYLEPQKVRLPFGEYERFFLNTWSAGSKRVFTGELIEAVNFFGVDNQLNTHKGLIQLLERKNKLIAQEKKLIDKGDDEEILAEKIKTSAIVPQKLTCSRGRVHTFRPFLTGKLIGHNDLLGFHHLFGKMRRCCGRISKTCPAFTRKLYRLQV